MQQHRRANTFIAALSALGLVAGACSGAGDPVDDAPSTPAATTDEPSSPAAATSEAEPSDAMGAVADPDGALWIYPPVEGAVLTFENSVAGEVTTSTGTVTAVDGGTVSVSEDVGEGVLVERRFVTSTDGGTVYDPGGFFASGEGFEVTAAGDSMLVPPIDDLEAGVTSSGETFVEFSSEGFDGRSDVTYTVAGGGFESVTVPAGTYDAYRVELTMQITTAQGQTFSGTSQYWFVPGFAVVRSEFSVGQVVISELASSTV